MRFRSGMTFALSAVVGLGGCAAAAPGTGGPVTSPTGIVYEPGTPPRQTSQSQAALLAIATGDHQAALEQAERGIESDPENPVHYYVAGSAYAGLGEFEAADEAWREAQRIYPAYELDIEPEREAWWAELFNIGVEAYTAGDMAATLEAWRQAELVYDLRPEASQNLAIILTQQGEYDEAIAAYRRGLAALEREPASRVLEDDEIEERAEARAMMEENLAQLLLHTEQYAEAEALLRAQLERNPDSVELRSALAAALSMQGRDAEANEIYTALLAEPAMMADDLILIGISLFNSGEYERAAEAFERVTQDQPFNRDAWYNYANALYAAEAWEQLTPIGDRLLEVDPLNENAALIIARAYREIGDSQAALAILERNHAAPVHVDGLQLQQTPGTTTLSGRVIGNDAQPGTDIRLRFTFYDSTGQLGAETVTVPAPAPEQSQSFEVSIDQIASAFRYELLQ